MGLRPNPGSLTHAPRMGAWRGDEPGARCPLPRAARGTAGTAGRGAAPSCARRCRRWTPAIDRFDLAVGTAAEFLRSAWTELRDVSFEIADMPAATDEDGIPRWTVLSDEKRIILYRLPIERLSHLHRDDDLHRRMMIEGSVFRAAAEYLDRDPWDLGPERFRYF